LCCRLKRAVADFGKRRCCRGKGYFGENTVEGDGTQMVRDALTLLVINCKFSD